MSRMVEVPEDDLRQILELFKGAYSDGVPSGRWEKPFLSLEALLPPVRVPVTKNTAWGTRLARDCGQDGMVFIGPDPELDEYFIGLDRDGVPAKLPYELWFEVPPSFEPAWTKPMHVDGPVLTPVCAGQKRRNPDGHVGLVTEVTRGKPNELGRAAFYSVRARRTDWFDESEVEGWELIQ